MQTLPLSVLLLFEARASPGASLFISMFCNFLLPLLSYFRCCCSCAGAGGDYGEVVLCFLTVFRGFFLQFIIGFGLRVCVCVLPFFFFAILLLFYFLQRTLHLSVGISFRLSSPSVQSSGWLNCWHHTYSPSLILWLWCGVACQWGKGWIWFNLITPKGQGVCLLVSACCLH